MLLNTNTGLTAEQLAAAKAARNAYAREYQREWRKKNPEKAKERELKYWARRAERERMQGQGADA